MGAVALSQSDEAILGSLQKTLGLPSKARVIHQALETLRQAVAREQLAQEIKKSVQKCGKSDLKEHQTLTGAAFHRLDTE